MTERSPLTTTTTSAAAAAAAQVRLCRLGVVDAQEGEGVVISTFVGSLFDDGVVVGSVVVRRLLRVLAVVGVSVLLFVLFVGVSIDSVGGVDGSGEIHEGGHVCG